MYEYRVEAIEVVNEADLQYALNKFAAEGWRVIDVLIPESVIIVILEQKKHG